MMTAHNPHSGPCTKLSMQELEDPFVCLTLLRLCFHGNIEEVVLLDNDFLLTFRDHMHFNVHPVVEFQVVSQTETKYPPFILI